MDKGKRPKKKAKVRLLIPKQGIKQTSNIDHMFVDEEEMKLWFGELIVRK